MAGRSAPAHGGVSLADAAGGTFFADPLPQRPETETVITPPGTYVRSRGFPRMKHAFLLSSVLMASTGMAAAQEPPTPATPPAQAAPSATASNCAPTKPVPPRGTIAPEGTTAGEPLSDKLAKSDGVLCPPADVDPEIRAPTPDAGNTPVIPPPGSPGGNPNLRPK
jgi:hypothetical protein